MIILIIYNIRNTHKQKLLTTMKLLFTLLLLIIVPLLTISQEYKHDIIAYRSDIFHVDSVHTTIDESVWITKSGVALVNMSNEIISFDFLRYEYYDFNVLDIVKSGLGINFVVSNTEGEIKSVEVIEQGEYIFFTVYIDFQYITFVTIPVPLKKEKKESEDTTYDTNKG